MTTPKLTTGQQEALRHLIQLRHLARRFVQMQQSNRESIANLEAAHARAIRTGDSKSEALRKIDVAAKESEVELRFAIIEVGQGFMRSCSHYDSLPRGVWLRALSVNESEWASPEMLKYGDSVRNVVAVLNLENSATGAGEFHEIADRPLNWCVIMAMTHSTQTNPKMGKAMHDISNQLFDGAFGEWQAPTMLEQIGVRQ
jgi:hypothetical protein